VQLAKEAFPGIRPMTRAEHEFFATANRPFGRVVGTYSLDDWKHKPQ
jgi:hypothetical protein